MNETVPSQVDVDELAREKVLEVERLLDSSESNNNFKLDINSWLSILQQIITAADLHRTNDKNVNLSDYKTKTETGESIYADYADDNEQFNALDLSEQFASNSVKWTIRVQAFKLVHRLVQLIKSPILKHLPDLVRLSFVAATSPYDDLKLQGFEMFKFLINRFASTEEREFPGHSILEQYKTQVLSAIKPAFNLDAPPYITAIASHVCCLWICRGLERDQNDLMRTYQMMMATIEKLENQSINQNSKLYTESELEQERLDILGSWAELYIAAKESESKCSSIELSKLSSPTKVNSKQLNELVKPQIASLIDNWWEALKDYALLIIPAPRLVSTTHDNEHVYTREVALRLFAPVWPKLLLASTIWVCLDEPKSCKGSSDNAKIPRQEPLGENNDNICDNLNGTSKTKYFNFICGLLMKEFCRCHSDNDLQKDSLPAATIFAIRSLFFIINNEEMKLVLVDDIAVAQELYTILYGILIKHTKSKSSQHMVLRNLIDQIFNSAATKIVERPGFARYGLSNLLNSMKVVMKALGEAIDGGRTNEFATIRVNLHIKIHSTVAIIRAAPQSFNKSNLLDALIENFQAILLFEAEPTLGTSLIGLLKELYSIMPEESASTFMRSMVNAQIKVVSTLLNLIQVDETLENDKKIQSLAIVDMYMKSLSQALELSDTNDRPELLTSYMMAVLGALSSVNQMSVVAISNRKDTLNLGLKYIEDIRLKYPNDFNLSLDNKTKQAYEIAVKLQQEIRAESEARRKAQVVERPTTNSVGLKRPPQAKIVLKADFSNFYAKKS